MAKQVLGKGLGALIRKQGGNESPPVAAPSIEVTLGDRVRQVSVNDVVPSPLQPRTHFTETQLDDLLESIRQHGIIQPLIVRPVNGKLELIAGERRWRASCKLGLTTVPVIEREASDRDVLEMALIENLQREDLTPIEEAAGYVRLSREFSMKQDEIAGRVGKSRASVANAMRLLDLHEDVQLLVAQSRLSVGHAKVILSLKDHPSQLLAADQILKRALTVRAAEKLIQSFHRESEQPRGAGESGASPVASPASQTDIMVRSIEAKLRDHFATHVTVHHGGKKGRIELEYYGNVDLQRLLDLLGLPNDEY